MVKTPTRNRNNRSDRPAYSSIPAARFLAPPGKTGPVKLPPWLRPPAPPTAAPVPRPGPLFKPPKIPRIPFGKRLPVNLLEKLPPSVLKRLFPWLLRGLPFVGAAITAYEIYDWMQNPDIGPDGAVDWSKYGGTLCCKDPAVFPLDSYYLATQTSDNCGGASSPTLCGLSGQIKSGDFPPRVLEFKSAGTARYVLFPGKNNLPRTRQTHGEIWVFPRAISNKGISLPAAKPFIPLVDFPFPAWHTPPVPFAPTPYPWAPPLNWPDAPESPEDRPQPQPQPEPAPTVAPVPGRPAVPAIDWSPGGPAIPSVHYPVPPDPEHERERKKRLKPDLAYRFAKFLEKAGGNYTEFDDNVAALYKGLSWKVRRWRGRDGVWRDRDITSTARLDRIFQYAQTVQFSVTDAIWELAKETASDAAFGRVGQAIKRKTEQNANAGFWAGLQGPSQRPDNNHMAEMYKELQRQRYQRNKKLRKYSVREEVSPGVWKRVEKYRPDNQIPWLRRDSVATAPWQIRNGRLSGGWRRHYYASGKGKT